MTAIQKKIVVDEKGKPLEVIIPWTQFCELMEELGLDLDEEAAADLRTAREDWAKGNAAAFKPVPVVATKYGVTVKAIQAANPGKDPARLQIGDKIKIPPKAVAAASTGTTTTAAADPSLYTVKSGDTLGKIAKDHKTTVSELQKLNNLTTTQIKVGQKLKMPSAGTPPPAQ